MAHKQKKRPVGLYRPDAVKIFQQFGIYIIPPIPPPIGIAGA